MAEHKEAGNGKQNGRPQLDLGKAGPKITSKFTSLALKAASENRLGLTARETYTAAALQIALDSGADEERRFAFEVLRGAGHDEIAKAYSELFKGGDVGKDTISAYTRLLLDLDNARGEPAAEPAAGPGKKKAAAADAAPAATRKEKKGGPSVSTYDKRKDDNDRLLERMGEFGLGSKSLDYVRGVLSQTTSKTGTVLHALEVCENAVMSGKATREEMTGAVDEPPSVLVLGMKMTGWLVQRICKRKEGAPGAKKPDGDAGVHEENAAQEESGLRTGKKKTRKKPKVFEIPEVTLDDVRNAARRLGLSCRVPDLHKSSRKKLTEFAVEMAQALPIDGIESPKDIVRFIKVYTKPDSEGGKGDNPRKYVEHLTLLVNSHGPKRAANDLQTMTVLRERKKLLRCLHRKRKMHKCDEVMAPLRSKMLGMGFDPGFTNSVVEHARRSAAGVPMMVRRLERMETEMGTRRARDALGQKPKMLIYPETTFKSALNAMKQQTG